MTLTKADLSEILFDRVGLNKREAKDMVEAFLKKFATHWKMATVSNYLVLAILN